MAEPDRVDFKVLDHKCVGSDTVVFNLEDGAIAKVTVDLDRVGVATNYKNPDGTPYYVIKTSLKIKVIPADKKFSLPKSRLRAPSKSHIEPPNHIA
ncbi:MAG: hypothetical protein H3Z50_07905 [archaeon]|nr:hypothetical protein [archaeon]MCP8306728.1 hypothetical protein [archaeon]